MSNQNGSWQRRMSRGAPAREWGSGRGLAVQRDQGRAHCGRAFLMEVRSDMRTVSKRSGTS